MNAALVFHLSIIIFNMISEHTDAFVLFSYKFRNSRNGILVFANIHKKKSHFLITAELVTSQLLL